MSFLLTLLFVISVSLLYAIASHENVVLSVSFNGDNVSMLLNDDMLFNVGEIDTLSVVLDNTVPSRSQVTLTKMLVSTALLKVTLQVTDSILPA